MRWLDGKQQELRKISLYIYRLKLLNISTGNWMMKWGVVMNENEAGVRDSETPDGTGKTAGGER